MDDDLDDLFGEGPSLQLPVVLPKGLLYRLDELCAGSCRQKLVWSRIGCIAYLTSDHRSVVLQHLHCNPRDGQWTLSKDYLLEDVRNSHGDMELVHLAWSLSGSELAIVDASGRVSIYAMMLGMNRFTMMRRVVHDPEDNMSALVGLMWFYTDRQERQEYFCKPMINVNNIWNFSCARQKPAGPKVPRDRPGLISVSRAGKAKVTFQTVEGWSDIKADLQIVSGVMDLLTHAAICPDKTGEKDGLLLATYDREHHIRLYRLRIDFEKQVIHSQILLMLDDCTPLDQELDSTLTGNEKLFSQARLTFLDIIPSGPESKSSTPPPPFLLAGFSYLADDFQTGGEQFTIMSRWKLEPARSNLHSSFDSLSQRKAPTNSESSNDLTLKRLADRYIAKTLITVQQVNVGTVMALIFSDGTVEFRDRTALEMLVPDSRAQQISSLPQIGFEFLGTRSSLHGALSPNASVIFTLDEQNAPSVNQLQIAKPLDHDAMSHSFFERMCEAFVLLLSSASLTTWNCTEDILYTLQTFSGQFLVDAATEAGLPFLSDQKAFKAHLLSEIYRVLGFALDHSMDQQLDQAFKSHYFQRCLNLQASLGYSGDDFSRSLPALVAWTILNSRHSTMVFAIAFSKNPNAKPLPGMPDQETKNPGMLSRTVSLPSSYDLLTKRHNLETVHFLLGLVTWFLAFMSYILDELFTISDHFADMNVLDTLDAAKLNEYLQENPSPVLPLLLASTSRAILRLDCRYIRIWAAESKSFTSPSQNSHPMASAQATLLARSYRELDSIRAKAHVDLDKIDVLLDRIDSAVKSTYSSAADASSANSTLAASKKAPSFTPEDRARLERDMLIRGTIPDILVKGVLRTLLSTTVDSLKEEVDVAEIYFADVGWLGLTLPSAPPPLPAPGSTAEATAKAAVLEHKRAIRHARAKARTRPLVDAMRKVLLPRRRQLKSPQHNGSAFAAVHPATSTTTRPRSFGGPNGTAPLRLRRCTRCCALSEDLLPVRGAGIIVAGVLRECFCGGRWMVLDDREDDEEAQGVDEDGNGRGDGSDEDVDGDALEEQDAAAAAAVAAEVAVVAANAGVNVGGGGGGGNGVLAGMGM